MPDDEWIKTLADGRRVKFTNQELLEDEAFITAQVEGNRVVYSIVLTKMRNPRAQLRYDYRAVLCEVAIKTVALPMADRISRQPWPNVNVTQQTGKRSHRSH